MNQIGTRLKEAYTDFKGSTRSRKQTIADPTKANIDDVISTVRTNRTYRRTDTDDDVQSLTVYFNQSGPITSVPWIVDEIASQHDLMEIDREYQSRNEALKEVVYVRKEDGVHLTSSSA